VGRLTRRTNRGGASGPGAGIPAWVTELAVNEWTELSSTRLDAQSLSGTLALYAWNGAAGDQENSRLIVGLAGGHGDGNWNGVVSLALNQTTPSMTVHYAGSNIGGGDTPYLSDGRPASRHTYYTQQYIPERDRLFMFGCGSLNGTNGVTERKVDAFSLGSNAFDASGTYADLPGTLPNAVSYTSARDPATGNVYVVWPYGSEQRLARWNQSTATWTELAQPGYLIDGYYMPMAVDTTRNRLVVFESNNFDVAEIFNIGTGAWISNVSMTNPVPAQSAVEYVEALDAFISREDAAGGALYSYHPTTFARTTISTTGGGSIPQAQKNVGGGGPFSRFRYFPLLGIAAYMPTAAGNCWAIKLHEV
jgi:hypothetical protein